AAGSFKDGRTNAPASRKIRNESEVRGTSMRFARSGRVIPAQTIIDGQLARDLPGILEEHGPLTLVHPCVHRSELLGGDHIVEKEIRVRETHAVGARSQRCGDGGRAGPGYRAAR